MIPNNQNVTLKMTAAGLIILSAALVCLRSGKDAQETLAQEAVPQVQTTKRKAHRAANAGKASVNFEPQISASPDNELASQYGADSSPSESRVRIPNSSPPSKDHTAVLPTQERAGLFSQAIQLAGDVRLPAALIPPRTATVVTPEVAQATAEIATEFYRDLQASVTTPKVDYESPADRGDVVLIPKGSQTEQARNRADELFRALYGDTAYNQHTIDSAIEVGLSPDASQD